MTLGGGSEAGTKSVKKFFGRGASKGDCMAKSYIYLQEYPKGDARVQ